MPQRNLLTLALMLVFSMVCYQTGVHNRYAAMLGESMQIVLDEYVENVTAKQLFEDAMRGMVSGLDPYSSYISQEDMDQFQEALDQEFGGIGIVVELPEESKRLTVMSPVVGTPAYRAGLRAGDVIMEIDGEDTEGMSLRDSVRLMRGKPGSTVDVVVRHAGEPELASYTIERAIIPVDSVLGDTRRSDGSWSFVLEEHPDVGYIRLTTFGELSSQELREALRQLEQQQVKGLILDLRNNAGGLLSTAIDLCDMFIEGGKIVSTNGRDGVEVKAFYARPQTVVPTDLPIALLVNGYSASASEILSACLQDHRRAVVVGERTYGKGTVQNVIPMEGGRSELKLTTASYWRPSGVNIHRFADAKEEDVWGVSPNEGMEVKLTDQQLADVMITRRLRDVVLVGDENQVLEPPLEEWSPPAADPQLLKAIEVIEQAASSASAPAAAAAAAPSAAGAVRL